jgi:hypothetical protein
MTYQTIFNKTLKDIRMLCNVTNNETLGNTIVKKLFDFSDELKDNDIIKGDNDNDKENVTREHN